MIIMFPVPGFVSVAGLAVFMLSGDGVQTIPGLPLSRIYLALFLLGKLLAENEFFHTDFLLIWFLKSVYQNQGRMDKYFVNICSC